MTESGHHPGSGPHGNRAPPLLAILAAGLGTRFGAEKPLAPVTSGGATLLDFAIFDAVRAGFERPIIVIRPELEDRWRRHLAEQFGASLRATFVHQPAPRGTGHALLCAAEHLDRPFAAANADDFYGRTSYERLFLRLQERTADNYAAVYKVADTLSRHGGVSRAVCRADRAGYLTEITEVLDIRESEGQIRGRTVSGNRLTLTGDEHVSMSLWGLRPDFVAALDRAWDRFRRKVGEAGAEERRDGAELRAESRHDGGGPRPEFRLSDATDEIVRLGEARVRVIPVRETGFGVTFSADVPDTRARIEALIERGDYPAGFGAASLRTGGA